MAEAETLPYMNAYGFIETVFKKMKEAATPERFTQDFLSTKLGVTSSSARPVIPLMKRLGFLGTDGRPTELYTRFRNGSTSGRAAAEALRNGFRPLFERNEYANDLNDHDLRGLVVETTGDESKSKRVKATVGSFNAIKGFANFNAAASDAEVVSSGRSDTPKAPMSSVALDVPRSSGRDSLEMSLSYTINLNLPETSNIEVFNAIFKSLRENLLR